MAFFSSKIGGRRDAGTAGDPRRANGDAWEGVAIHFVDLNINGNVVKANHGLFTVKVNGPLPVESEQTMHFVMGATPGVATRVRVVFCERQIVGDSEYLALVA